jgi:hypothetical protein
VTSWTTLNAIQTEARGYVNAPGLVVPAGSGPAARLVARVHSAANYEENALVALQASGAPAWTIDIGTGRQIAGFDNFELLDDLDGDGERELFLTELDTASEQQMVIRKGAGGGVLVQRPTAGLFPPNGVYLQGHATADINGDGILDIISALHGSWFIGMDVSKAGTTDPLMGFVQIFRASNGPNGQAMVGQLDADPEIDLVRANSQNAFGPYERRDLLGNVEASYLGPQPQVASTDANTAALVTRPGAAGSHDFVWAGMAGDALGAVARLDGATMTEAWFVYLAGGNVYPKAAMPATRSALSSPIAVDLDGDAADEIVVGSNDGYLYALATVDGSLKWSLALGAPVVHTIAADIDKDDRIELLVSLADGMLVALDATGAYDSDDVTPEPQPDGGPAAGTGGSGGMTGSGGMGTTTGSGGMGGTASGGATAAGGNGATPGEEGGCGCALPGAGSNSRAAVLAWMALAWLWIRRANRRRCS